VGDIIVLLFFLVSKNEDMIRKIVFIHISVIITDAFCSVSKFYDSITFWK